jgi:uncharacterized protein
MKDDVETAARPVPVPSALTRGFWEAAARRVLVRPVCDRCGASFFSPQVACPRCLSEAWAYRESTGRGSIYSFTVVHRPPSPAFAPPYVIADVSVDEGWNLLTNVVGCRPDEVRIGQRVAVRWEPVSDDIVLPVFGPEADA